MTKTKLFLDDEDLLTARYIMKEKSQPWAWVKTGGKYQGLLKLDIVEDAIRNKKDDSLSDLAEKPAYVSANDTIEELIRHPLVMNVPIL